MNFDAAFFLKQDSIVFSFKTILSDFTGQSGPLSFLNQVEVNFGAEGVDADNFDQDRIAQTEGSTVSVSFDDVFREESDVPF